MTNFWRNFLWTQNVVTNYFSKLPDTGSSNLSIELFGIKRGIICQQVNCMDKYGAGLSGVIAGKYPVVEYMYHAACSAFGKKSFGYLDLIPLGNNTSGETFMPLRTCPDALFVANIFSQVEYGNSNKTGKVYTDVIELVSSIIWLLTNCDESLPVYLPHHVDSNGDHNGIGCGLAGARWTDICGKLNEYVTVDKLKNLYLIDTYTNEVTSFLGTEKV